MGISSWPAPGLLSDWPDALAQSVELEAAHGLELQRTGALGERMWDAWHARALAAGVSEELAALGRTTMREAIVSDWSEVARTECGALDDGEAMLDFACADPEGAERAWSELLESGGLRARMR